MHCQSESDVTHGQVWWPIPGIRALLLTHPKCTHTQQWTHTPWTHTRSSGQPFMLRRPWRSCGFGALLKGTSSWYWGRKRALFIHSPHLQFLPARNLNSQPLDYESNSLTIRPRLPCVWQLSYTIVSISKSIYQNSLYALIHIFLYLIMTNTFMWKCVCVWISYLCVCVCVCLFDFVGSAVSEYRFVSVKQLESSHNSQIQTRV